MSEPQGVPGPWATALPWALACLVVLGVGITADLHLSLWIDEAYSLDTATRSLADTYQRALRFELQPPAYFILLNLWLRIAPSIEWARLLSTLAAVACVLVLHRVARVIGAGALILPLVAALSPRLLWAASESRGYALGVLWVALALLFFVRAWLVSDDPPAQRQVVGFVASAYLGMLTFYYTGFVFAGMGLAGLAVKPRSRSLWVALAVLAALMAPWVPTILHQASQHPNYQAYLPGGIAAQPLTYLGRALRDMVFRGAPVMERSGAGIALAATVAAVLAVRIWSRRYRPWTRVETGMAVIAVFPLAALAALRVFTRVDVEPRHWTPALVGPLVALVTIASRCEGVVVRRALLTLLLGIGATSTISFLRNGGSRQDWRAALAWMREHGDAPAEPVVVFNGESALALRYYVPAGRVVAVPRDANMQRFTLDDQALTTVDALALTIRATVPPGGSFWLLRRLDVGPWFRPGVLDEFVRCCGRVLAQTEVRGLTVQHLQLTYGAVAGSNK